MPDESTAAGQASEAGQGGQEPQPAGGTASPAAPASGAGPQSGQSGDSAEIKALRDEAAKYRRQVRDLEARVAKEEEAKLTEQQKVAKRAEDAEAKVAEIEQRLKAATSRGAVVAAATRAGIVDPDVAYTLVAESIAYDADGTPKNVDDLVTNLAKTKPYLLGGQASAGNPERSGQAGATLTEQQQRERIYGPQHSIFDAAFQASKGGGVLFGE